MSSSSSESTKTAATVLQELMMKRKRTPEYECVGQRGLNHQIVFEYQCSADGVSVRAKGHSKKDAKQAAAKRALAALAGRGDNIPPPFNILSEEHRQADGEELAVPGASGVSVSYVTRVKELCDQHKLAAPKYEVVGDSGPPHLPQFTISAALGKYKFLATANNKRQARQMAAELLYKYLRENMARVTDDSEQVRASTMAYEKQRVAALAALDSTDDERVKNALAALNLESTVEMLGPMMVLSVPRAIPPLSFAAVPPEKPEDAAAEYLRLALTAT